MGEIRTSWSTEDIPSALNPPLSNLVLGPLFHRYSRGDKTEQVVPKCSYSLPSWTVCWTCPSPLVAQLPRPYHAGGIAFSSPHIISSSSSALTLKGVCVDTIKALSSFHIAESDNRYPTSAPLVEHL
jgi:hypothetical protein